MLSFAVGFVCRTIKLWDLEKFTMIGSLEGDTTPVRSVFPVQSVSRLEVFQGGDL